MITNFKKDLEVEENSIELKGGLEKNE